MVDFKTSKPNNYEDVLTQMHNNQWFTWTDYRNKIYDNLRLTEKVGIDGKIVDNPIKTLPTKTELDTKLKELQDAWDSENG